MKRKNLWVCPYCLATIESHEGRQTTLRHEFLQLRIWEVK